MTTYDFDFKIRDQLLEICKDEKLYLREKKVIIDMIVYCSKANLDLATIYLHQTINLLDVCADHDIDSSIEEFCLEFWKCFFMDAFMKSNGVTKLEFPPKLPVRLLDDIRMVLERLVEGNPAETMFDVVSDYMNTVQQMDGGNGRFGVAGDTMDLFKELFVADEDSSKEVEDFEGVLKSTRCNGGDNKKIDETIAVLESMLQNKSQKKNSDYLNYRFFVLDEQNEVNKLTLKALRRELRRKKALLRKLDNEIEMNKAKLQDLKNAEQPHEEMMNY